jgi:hypothetical protein
MPLVFFIFAGIFLGIFHALHIHQVRHRLGLLGVDLALCGLLDRADHECGEIVDRFTDLVRGDAACARIGETVRPAETLDAILAA